MLVFVNDDDLRAKELNEELLRRHYYVTNELSDLKYADVIYLGKKGIDRKHRLMMRVETQIVLEDVFKNLKKHCLVLTLMDNAYLKELSLKYGFRYLCLLKQDDFLKKNSILTAEGLIAYLISHRRFPLYQSRVAVLGYGHCAKPIIEYLKAFHALVSVIVRDEKYQEDIMKNGCCYENIKDMDLSQYDMIINTIPAVVLHKKEIDTLSKQVMIVDIASYPYGVDHHYALSLGLHCLILPSIPCKYAYGYAGKMIVDVIEKEISHA